MKKSGWILLSFLCVPWASAETLSTANGSANLQLLPSTTIGVDSEGNETVYFSGVPVDTCTPLQGATPPGATCTLDGDGGWSTSGPGIYEFTFFEGTEAEWDVWVKDAMGRNVEGRVFSKSWQAVPSGRESTDPSRGVFDLTVYIKTRTDAVVEARLQGLDAEKLYLFASPPAPNINFESKTFGDLGVNPMGLQPANEALRLINPDISNNHSIYLSEIPSQTDEKDPVVEAFKLNECPSGEDSTEPAIIIDSDSVGVHYTSCLGVNGEYDWGTGNVSVGENTVPWSDISRWSANLGPGTYDCTTIVVREKILLPLVGVGTAFEGIRLFRVEPNGDRIPMYMHWIDSGVFSGESLGPNGETLLMNSDAFGMRSGDPTHPSVAFWEDVDGNVLGNARAWGAFAIDSKAYTSVMNTWAYVYASEKADGRFIIPDMIDCEEPEEMEPEEMEPEEMEPEELEPEPEVPDENPEPPGFQGTATGGACSAMGWGNTSFVILALFAFVGTFRRRK